MVKSDFHDSLDAKSVDVPHAEVLDTQGLQKVAAEQITQMILKADMLEHSSSAAALKSFRQKQLVLTALRGPRLSVRYRPGPVKTGMVWSMKSQEYLASGSTERGTLKYSLRTDSGSV